VKLFFQYSQFSLHLIKLDAIIFSSLALVLSDKFINFSHISSFAYISKCSVAVFRNQKILFFERQFGKSFPVCLSFCIHVQRVQNRCSFIKVVRLNSKAKLNQRLIQRVRNLLASLIYYDLSFPICSVYFFYITLYGVDCHFVRILYRIPDTQVVPVLSHYHLTLRYPLRVRTVIQQSIFCLRLYVVQV
jgi:hypothetical protein